jgi:hypothetical protein
MNISTRSNRTYILASLLAVAVIYFVVREVDRCNNHWAQLDFVAAERLFYDDLNRGIVTLFSEKDTQISTLSLKDLTVRLVPFVPTKETGFFSGLEQSPPCFATHYTSLLVRSILQPQASANPLVREHSGKLADLLFLHQPSARVQIDKQRISLAVLKPILETNSETAAMTDARRGWISY